MNIAVNGIEIKFISESDLEKNKQILIELLEENYSINFPERNNLKEYAINSYKDMVRFNKDNSAILVGAYDSTKIVGFLWAYKREFLGEKRIHIGHIIVNSSVRARGIGTKLLDRLEMLACQEEIYKIELMATLENENTMKFYKSKNFNITRVQLEKKLGELNENRKSSGKERKL